MIGTILAVVGTLLGAVVSGLFQHKSAGRTEQTARREQHRREQLDAITTLAQAISDHRRAMWMRGDAKLKHHSAERQQELRGESHLTRSAVTRPLVAMRLLVTDPAVRTAADHMVTLTYAMRNADTSTDHLTEARAAALDAHDAFVNAAAAYLQTV
ncbi:hypothetical protein ACFY1A_48200 [Streptomyces sp. NPDC001520]|uniref:hypothetical protein n=1 Tax=Streptomyces sp. NPDC001520 TaxID=3364581 RepID=UPI00369171BF